MKLQNKIWENEWRWSFLVPHSKKLFRIHKSRKSWWILTPAELITIRKEVISTLRSYQTCRNSSFLLFLGPDEVRYPTVWVRVIVQYILVAMREKIIFLSFKIQHFSLRSSNLVWMNNFNFLSILKFCKEFFRVFNKIFYNKNYFIVKVSNSFYMTRSVRKTPSFFPWILTWYIQVFFLLSTQSMVLSF